MIKKTKLALSIATATLTLASVLIAPEVAAHNVKKTHHAKKHAHSTTTYSRRITSSYVTDSSAKVDALEAQVQNLQAELSALRSDMVRPAAGADTAKVQELDQWMASMKANGGEAGSKNNMVFFRGGFSRSEYNRGGTLDPDLGGSPNGSAIGNIGNQDAWYFGAGFDFSLNDNLFGLMNGTEVIAELMFDYKELADKQNNGLSKAEVDVVNTLGTPPYNLPNANTQNATVNQLTLAASPKIKLFKGQSFRPWLIPAGFELSVISPPSDAITVLNPGMQFGVGADYKIWKDLYIGADARYHYSMDNIDGVNTDGVTAGGYLGIGF